MVDFMPYLRTAGKVAKRIGITIGIVYGLTTLLDLTNPRHWNPWERLNPASRLEQITHNTNERLMDYTDKHDANLSNLIILQKEADETNYFFSSKKQVDERTSEIEAKIETVPDFYGDFSYVIIKKKDEDLFRNEWNDAKVIIGEGKKKVMKLEHIEDEELIKLIESANSNNYSSPESITRTSIENAFNFELGEDDKEFINNMIANHYEIVNKNYKEGITVSYVTRGFKVLPSTKITLNYPSNKEVELLYIDLEPETQKIVRNMYHELGVVLNPEARTYKKDARYVKRGTFIEERITNERKAEAADENIDATKYLKGFKK